MYRADRADEGTVLISLLFLAALPWKYCCSLSWGWGGGVYWAVIIGPPGVAGPRTTSGPGP